MNSAKLPQGTMNDAINAVYPLIPTDGSSVGQRLEIAKAIVEAVLQATQQSRCSVTDEMVAVALNEYHHRSGSERRDISFEFQRQNYPDLVDGMRRALEAALGTQQAKDSQ